MTENFTTNFDSHFRKIYRVVFVLTIRLFEELIGTNNTTSSCDLQAVEVRFCSSTLFVIVVATDYGKCYANKLQPFNSFQVHFNKSNLGSMYMCVVK